MINGYAEMAIARLAMSFSFCLHEWAFPLHIVWVRYGGLGIDVLCFGIYFEWLSEGRSD